MAILLRHNDEIDETKYYTDEQKIEHKKLNEGKTICPIMSPQIIQWNGCYAVCVKGLCALWVDARSRWDDGHCAFR